MVGTAKDRIETELTNKGPEITIDPEYQKASRSLRPQAPSDYKSDITNLTGDHGN